MNTYELFEMLRNAYGNSTRNCNRFLKALNSVEWEEEFECEDGYYFIYGDLTINAESLEPFGERWKPCAMFNDGTVIEF